MQPHVPASVSLGWHVLLAMQDQPTCDADAQGLHPTAHCRARVLPQSVPASTWLDLLSWPAAIRAGRWGCCSFSCGCALLSSLGPLSACLRDRRIERPCLLALVILVEDLCGRVSACYNEGMVTPVIAPVPLNEQAYCQRNCLEDGRACKFFRLGASYLSAVTFHYADTLQTYIQAFNIFRRYGSVKRLAQPFTTISC